MMVNLPLTFVYLAIFFFLNMRTFSRIYGIYVLDTKNPHVVSVVKCNLWLLSKFFHFKFRPLAPHLLLIWQVGREVFVFIIILPSYI